MDILNDLKRKIKGSKGRLKEEAIYLAVMKEMKAGLKSDGLWGQAISETEGNEKKAKALYIKLRVQSLKDEINIYQEQQDQIFLRKEQLEEERKHQLEAQREKTHALKKAQEEEKQRKYEERVIRKFNQEYSFLRRKLPGAWFFISMLILLYFFGVFGAPNIRIEESTDIIFGLLFFSWLLGSYEVKVFEEDTKISPFTISIWIVFFLMSAFNNYFG